MGAVFGINRWRKENCDKETKAPYGENTEEFLLEVPRETVAKGFRKSNPAQRHFKKGHPRINERTANREKRNPPRCPADKHAP